MTLDTLIMLAGGLVALMPFLGFPPRWDAVIFFILGIFIVLFGVMLRRREDAKHMGHMATSAQPLDDGEVA